MALIDIAAREIHAKIVYYGPGLSGKTTNLYVIHRSLPEHAKSDLVSIDTEQERTLFFDFLPLDVGTIHGYRLRLQLYTVPGQTLYRQTRVAVLSGADGVVFVADAQRERLSDNLQSLRELAQNLIKQGKRPIEFPLVLQYNKMDLPSALPISVLDRYLNPMRAPRYPAIAVQAVGVVETLRATIKLVIDRL
ncbi:MAG: GTPase domain-containing protein [Thermomicrobium sp.]|nr:GTPase domain-containing protein [Thermomicrobium sp.]MCS7246137.1 GTPase domain-containing protein [Thermomicrobium sp.]MDW7981806.1 GTPase domain-containing protein [Thermomicrobium sp.]